MKIKYRGRIYEAVEWADGTLRTKGGIILAFGINNLVEGAEVQEDAPADDD